jgi:von Willebrand factor A domain-containing protein 8
LQYRLDRGHKVHQVSDEAKAEVSEEAKEAGQRIAEKALKDRLREIGMSETEHERYSHFLRPIQWDIANLRTTLQSVKVSGQDRDWIKRQLYGELDDSKLVEGVAGERHVFKRRGIVEPSSNSSFVKRQKRLRFVVDCSASMYRFNGYDDRLNRCLQATTLVMESLAGMEDKYDFSIVGHSGDSRCIELVSFGNPPLNELERMRILDTMVAHSQFCRSGDNTLGAIMQAIADVSNLGHGGSDNDFENSSSIVIAISDANLERYGIGPQELGRAMDLSASSSSNTKAFCIFIASFGDEAEEMKRALPIGKGFICRDTSDLPVIVRNILTTEIG